jgi:hypothetical protein
MSFITYVIFGFFLGAVGIGLPTLRTLEVIKGNYGKVFVYSVVSSCALFTFTQLVASGNFAFMLGNVLGSSLSVTWIAYHEKYGKWIR